LHELLSHLFAKLAFHTPGEQDKPPTRVCCELAEVNLCYGKIFSLEMYLWAAGSAACVGNSGEDIELFPFECTPITAADKKDKIHYNPNFHKVL